MKMRFSPKTENEIATEGLLEPGVYGFEIMEAEDATSKAGNDMIKLRVHVFNGDGEPMTIFDYLLESVAYKLRHAAEACGLLDDYESGALNALDFRGKTGQCKVSIQKDKSGQYPDRNGIADYLKPESVAAPRAAARPAPRGKPVMAGAGSDLDDEIPF